MKQFHLFFSVFICLSIHAIGQNITADLFVQPANTGVNMTVAINASSLDQYEGGQIGAFYDLNGDGTLQCVGVQPITTGFFGLALWGDDSFTPELDGLSSSAVPQFAILFEGNVILFNESPQFSGYVTNGITNITDTDLPSQILYPIEDPNFLAYLQENYPQTIVNDSLDIDATGGITFMYISELELTDIDGIKFFTDLSFLICNSNQLTSLPELPQGLISIECMQNQLTSLPELPQSLNHLYCVENQITNLPELPQSLLGLYCSSNELTSLPELPEGLKMIDCTQNLITNLPELPEDFTQLYCSENQLSSLPEIPQSLEELDCSDNQLTSLPELPELLIYLDFSINPIECITNYLFQFEELNAYPLCDVEASYCDSIYLTVNNQSNEVLEVEITTSFTSYSIPYAGLMLRSSSGDTIAMETLSSAGNVYAIYSNMYENRNLFFLNDLVLPFTGELCVVEGLFAGTANIVCTYPITINEIYGCTGPDNCNYNPIANVDDGSCTYPTEIYLDCYGNCISDSDGDGICDEIELYGCTDPNASNYNINVSDDDGSCQYSNNLYPIEDPYFLNYLQNNYPEIIVNDSLDINATAGIDTLDLPFMSYFTNIDPVQFFNDLTYLSCWGQNLTSLPELPDGLLKLFCFSNQLTSLPELPDGLIDLQCFNNQLTSLPELPNSLILLQISQNNITSLPVLPENLQLINFTENPLECVSNYLPQLQELNAYPLCEQSFSFCEQDQWLIPFQGNTGSNMTLLLQENFVTSLNIQTNNAYIVATTETGLIVGSSYLNNTQTSLAVWGDDSFTPEIDGATDGQLINLNLIDSNLLFDINTSFNYVTNNLDVISNEVSPVLSCTAENLGCTDESACNYNAEAIIEDGSCTYSETYFDCNGNCINDIDGDGICDELEVPGCLDPNASNYNNNATDEDGTCVFLGCTDQEACNWDSEANTDDGSCIYAETYFDCNGNCINDSDTDGICDELEVPGCTNPNATNYNSNATDDDGTCMILGCTDQEACNWDAEANTDDESCIYAEIYYNCDGSCINDFDLDGECDEIDYDDGIGINEVEAESAQLIKMIDVLGREYKEHKKGMLLFYIYENGKVEKRVIH